MRWVVSPIIGNGTSEIEPGSEATTGPYRAKASDYGSFVSIVPGNDDGTPKFNWCLCRIDESAAAAADADPDLIVFPDLTLDHVLTTAQRNWLITKLTNRGLPTGWITPGITVREVVRTIGRWLESNFDVDWMRIG